MFDDYCVMCPMIQTSSGMKDIVSTHSIYCTASTDQIHVQHKLKDSCCPFLALVSFADVSRIIVVTF